MKTECWRNHDLWWVFLWCNKSISAGHNVKWSWPVSLGSGAWPRLNHTPLIICQAYLFLVNPSCPFCLRFIDPTLPFPSLPFIPPTTYLISPSVHPLPTTVHSPSPPSLIPFCSIRCIPLPHLILGTVWRPVISLPLSDLQYVLQDNILLSHSALPLTSIHLSSTSTTSWISIKPSNHILF